MKTYILTRAIQERFKVLPVIEKYDLDPIFVVHTPRQKVKLTNLGVYRSSIVVSNQPQGVRGATLGREYVAKNLMDKGKWCMWLDDNVYDITALPHKLSTDKIDIEDGNDWRELFKNSSTKANFQLYLGEVLEKAETVGTIYAGFGVGENYFFRLNKWQQYGYCRTQLALYKNDGSTWRPFPSLMWEDAAKSIDVVARYGQVVINRHVRPLKQPFELGGIGSFKTRLPHLKDNCKRLIKMYPGLVKYQGNGSQYGMPDAVEFHLTFAKRSFNTVNKWREAHGYL